MKPKLIAHRGDTIHCQENTIEAFRSALDLGADGIECDVQLHHGQLIVVHHYLFDKKATYPLLSEVLELFIGRGMIEIEVKELDPAFLPQFVQLLSKYPDEHIEITSSFLPIIPYVRKAMPKAKLGVIFPEYDFETWMTPLLIERKVIQTMKLLQSNVAHLPLGIINRQLAFVCRYHNIKLHAHIKKQSMKKQTEQYGRIAKLGVDQCTFDDINLLKNLEIH